MEPRPPISTLLMRALQARAALIDAAHNAAFRVFNGFTEGEPALAIDIYAATAVFHDYDDAIESGSRRVHEAAAVLREALPWLRCGLVKTRAGTSQQARRGRILFGHAPDCEVRENGVTYAVDLLMNRDASLYLDTRGLRLWAFENLRGRTVLNTFAYTGSLGIAALAGGATHVVQLDLNRRFLDLARRSCALNGLDPHTHEILAGDFFPRVAQLKRSGRLFGCVLLDPPFFATSARGTVDLEAGATRLINKVRPLIAHNGRLVVVNNALYVSGAAFMAELETLCTDGHLAIEQLVPVPEDFVGYASTKVGAPVTDPAPFNHATKIVILRVTRKAG